MRATRPDDDPVDPWLIGWTSMRDLRVTELDGWPLVHVRAASRRSELVCADVDADELRRLLVSLDGDPGAMLTAAGEHVAHLLGVPTPAGVRLDRDDETLMTARLLTSRVDPSPAPPDGLLAVWDESPVVSRYALEDGDRVVAEGAVGVVGDWATIDAVETAASHRRRGLGRHVIDRLTQRGRELGASRGVLAASADGRALYEALGWRVERHLLSWMGG